MHGYDILAFLKYVNQFLIQLSDFIVTLQNKKLL